MPRDALSWRRAAKPWRSARASAMSMVSAKFPLSTLKPKALVIGVGAMLRRRSSTRSKPWRRAAASISRSMTLIDLAKPGPRVTPIGVVLVSTAFTPISIAGMA